VNTPGPTDGFPEPMDGFPLPAADRSADHRRVAVDPETVGRDLTALVLTVVELIRQLMERQAIRRIDEGDLTADQIEAIGVTLMALEDRMTELREHFGLSVEDLNIDLGPLGWLLAPEQ
jgi:hypothetical protein